MSYFDKGIVHMTFEVKDLEQKRIAQTNYVSSDSYHIEFNSQMINQYGWSSNHKGFDNIGYDWSKARTAEERLVITLAHEAIHAKHYATYEDAMREGAKNLNYSNRNNRNESVAWLFQNGYSQEFVEIFFAKKTNNHGEQEWVDANVQTQSDRAHEYMRKYDHSVIDKALEEYRRDRGL